MRLILASTSPYRRLLLERLGLPFDVARPDTDETPQPGETPAALVQRLAIAKAMTVSAQAPDAWVIGSDQAAELAGVPVGKSGHRDAAVAQLQTLSGRAIRFHTAVCLTGPDGQRHTALDMTTVNFRVLSEDEIERYVDREQPFDCAGSFKSEGLGIALFDGIDSRDPTALIGLPLIATSALLRQAGFKLP